MRSTLRVLAKRCRHLYQLECQAKLDCEHWRLFDLHSNCGETKEANKIRLIAMFENLREVRRLVVLKIVEALHGKLAEGAQSGRRRRTA